MINTNVVKNYQTAEYGKFVELTTDYPAVSVTRLSYPDNSSAFPSNSGVLPLSTVDIYPKYAVLAHLTNPEDIDIVLNAGDITVELEALEALNVRQNTLLESLTSKTEQLKTYVDDLEKNTFDTASACDDIYHELKNTKLANYYPIGFTRCETRTTGNPSFIPRQLIIHNSQNNDTDVFLTLTSGLTCSIPIGKNTSANHIMTVNIAATGIDNYNGCTITFLGY